MSFLLNRFPKKSAESIGPRTCTGAQAKPERFVRPVRWFVAMLGDCPVPLEFGGVKAGTESRGHRILGRVRANRLEACRTHALRFLLERRR